MNSWTVPMVCYLFCSLWIFVLGHQMLIDHDHDHDHDDHIGDDDDDIVVLKDIRRAVCLLSVQC